MLYPKTVNIQNLRLKELLTKKAELITLGRAKSEEIEQLEKEMEETDKQVQEEEKKVDISDLLEKEKAITAKVDDAIKEMNALKQQIYDKMIKEVSSELHTKYDELKKKKEELETERNKIALKAQKYTDRIIPLGRELMKPFLEDMYDDYESIQLIDGEIQATIFSHLQDFKNNFKKK